MTRGRARVHLDASTAGQPLRRALCGWLDVDTETEVSLVTCKACLARLAANRAAATGEQRAGKTAISKLDVEHELVQAFEATLAPCAGPPPLLTPALWAASCRGAEHRRCGECELCAWEREATMWYAVSPWNHKSELQRAEGAPRWSSLAAALVTLVEFDRHDRHGPSAMGGILDRCKRGDAGDGGATRPDDPMQRRAGELVRVRQALELAYPAGAHATLTASQCIGVLLVRTAGVMLEMPTYEELAAELGAAVGDLRALVRSGRAQVTAELAERGLIPRPSVRVRSGRGPNEAVMYGQH